MAIRTAPGRSSRVERTGTVEIQLHGLPIAKLTEIRHALQMGADKSIHRWKAFSQDFRRCGDVNDFDRRVVAQHGRYMGARIADDDGESAKQLPVEFLAYCVTESLGPPAYCELT